MNPYQIVFSDIDGTLLDSTFRVREATAAKIRELDRRGIPFILVSARMPRAIYLIQDAIGVRYPIVCHSGALTLDEERRPVRSIGFDKALALELLSRIGPAWPGTSLNLYADDRWLVDDAQDPRIVFESEVIEVPAEQGDFGELLSGVDQVHKILLICQPETTDQIAREITEAYPMLAAHRSSTTYLEITDRSAVKSGAVRAICEHYGIPLEKAVSFGDNFNDVDMLRATGLGVAMANAPEPVRRSADRITLDNNHEGVLHMLEQLGL
ncbi:Cof-type HAD-IIB family hydrolase [Feifania hominis]|uniref:HAD family phosphatase n=1 Tax=Feifania hominis TaxID=2763660 RepID=A0A926HTN1_9FIRM|nr:Cof-type HAD-IIB family hydrolase [Feifania hominis]MBC8535473.1 HAD family phosphatase [Feifania hominis]